MGDSSFNSQVFYGFGVALGPAKIQVDGKDVLVPTLEDFLAASGAAEGALGQKILQDNAEKVRIRKLIDDAALTPLDPGTATTAQLAAQNAQLIAILTNLVVGGTG